MAYVIRISRTGGPEVLEWVEIPTRSPAAGEALVRHTAIGLNFIDMYQRSGLYKLPLPATMGNEGVGIVEAVGAGVTVVKVGDRVAYQGSVGAYAEVRTIPAEKLVVVPKGIDDRVAAAAFLKGVTAYYLLHRTFKVGKGNTILWHAAAGGVGQIACQWAKALGATVIGTVGSDDKMALARANGCDHVLNYRTEDYVARVKEITGGIGVDVAYDSIGADTFPATLDCVRLIGTWVTFGNASGPVPAFPADPADAEGLAVRDAADHGALPRQACRPRAGHRGAVRGDRRRHGEGRDRADVRAQGCGRGAPGAGKQKDDRGDGVDSLISASPAKAGARVPVREPWRSEGAVPPGSPPSREKRSWVGRRTSVFSHSFGAAEGLDRRIKGRGPNGDDFAEAGPPVGASRRRRMTVEGRTGLFPSP